MSGIRDLIAGMPDTRSGPGHPRASRPRPPGPGCRPRRRPQGQHARPHTNPSGTTGWVCASRHRSPHAQRPGHQEVLAPRQRAGAARGDLRPAQARRGAGPGSRQVPLRCSAWRRITTGNGQLPASEGSVRGNLAAHKPRLSGNEGTLAVESLGLWPIVMQLRQPGSWVSVGVLGGCLRFHQHDLPVRPLVIATPVGYGLAPSASLSGRYRCRPPSPAPPRGHVGAKPNRYKLSQQWMTLCQGARSAPLRGLAHVCATLPVAMRNLAVDARPTQSPFHSDLDSLGTG